MRHPLLVASLSLSLAASLGCSSPPASGSKAEAAGSKAASSDPAAESPHGGPAVAHGDPANPHAGMANPANPHAGMANPANPHGLPAAAPPGPPRDVTPSGETRAEVVEGLRLTVPTEWTAAPAANPMRKAELALPGPGGDAQLVVYRFPGGAGGAQENIVRWKGQIELAEGAEAATSEQEVNGLKVTSVDARGRFAGMSMPGAPPQPPIEAARLLAAAIEGSGDPYYLKLVGPAATLDVWSEAWTALLASLAPETP